VKRDNYADMSDVIKNHVLPFGLVLLACIFTTNVLINNQNPFPYSSDSASYIEQARSLIRGNAAVETSFGLSGPDKAPSAWFPIGFPIFLYSLSFLGVDPVDGAVLVGKFSAVMFPIVFYFGFRSLLSNWMAALIACLASITPSILIHSPNGLTDTFSLFLSLISIILAIRCRNAIDFFFLGLCVAVSYAVRNAQLALIAAMLVWILWRCFEFKDQSGFNKKYVLYFFIGMATVIIPLIVRNVSLFGGVSAYSMAPSTIGLSQNIRDYVGALMFDITAIKRMEWSYVGIVLFVGCMFLVAVLLSVNWKRMLSLEKRVVVLVIAYSVIGSIMVVVARTKYQWGEEIGIRHTLPYVPFMLALIPLLTKYQAVPISRKLSLPLSYVVLLPLVSTHLYYVFHDFSVKSIQNNAINAFRYGEKYMCNQPSEKLLVSNWAYVYRILCESPARHIGHVNLKNDPSRMIYVGSIEGHSTLLAGIESISSRYPRRGVNAVFIPGRHGVNETDLPMNDREINILSDAGWRVVENSKNGLVLNK
jgi:hypothetical protein